MSALLNQALVDTPVGVLVVNLEDGTVEDFNEVASLWFKIVLSVGDCVKDKLRDIDGIPVDFLEQNNGNIQFGHSVYHFVCGRTTHEHTTYCNVCLFDQTDLYQKYINAKSMTKIMNAAASAPPNSLSPGPLEENREENLSKFEQECSLDAGFGFSKDPNATMVQYSPTGVVLHVNKALRGFQPEEILGTHAYEHIHPDDIEDVTAYHLSLLEDPRRVVPMNCYLRKLFKTTGKYVPIELIGAYHFNETGIGVKYFNCVERVLSNERMDTLLSSVTDKLPCGVVMVDKTTGLVDIANPNIQSWLAIKQGDRFCEGLDRLRNNVFSDEECDKLLVTMKSLQQNKKLCLDVTVKTLQGRVLNFHCRFNETSCGEDGLLVDTRGDHALVWIVNDITGLNNEMEEKQSAIIRFMRCTSHDMRTPLTAITLAGHSLASYRGVEELSEIMPDVNTIVSSTAVLESIMSNILEFKNISSMNIIPMKRPVNVRHAIHRLIDLLRYSTLVSEGVTLDYSCQWEGDEHFLVDDKILDRIVLNLASNSLKFTSQGHVKVRCSFEESVDQENISDEMVAVVDSASLPHSSTKCRSVILKFDIDDTGCGMDKASQEHVGELDFFSTSASGFGLGTYIVRSYINILGGKFDVQSQVGVGTTMTVQIPSKLTWYPEETKQSTITQQHEPPIAISDRDSKRAKQTDLTNIDAPENDKLVLVVEDINVNRKLIVRSLRKGGFQVEEAENGAVALQMMLEKDYDTVFMDINMPVMNGNEAVKEFWKRKRQLGSEDQERPRIVILTGNITETTREMALDCGAHDFLTKPVIPRQLLEAASWDPG